MFKRLPLPLKQGLYWAVTGLSAMGCVVAPWLRGPGLELAGLTPDWPLIWVVCWSVRRTAMQGAMAGLVLGFLQDGLTNPRPTHALGLAIVGILTARLQKQRFVQEDFISVALIVFGMVVVSETLMAVQWSLLTRSVPSYTDLAEPFIAGDGPRTLESIWLNHQKNALSSAILSSLWAPALYLPLRYWWRQQENKPERGSDP